jgi:hypothetical protein
MIGTGHLSDPIAAKDPADKHCSCLHAKSCSIAYEIYRPSSKYPFRRPLLSSGREVNPEESFAEDIGADIGQCLHHLNEAYANKSIVGEKDNLVE